MKEINFAKAHRPNNYISLNKVSEQKTIFSNANVCNSIAVIQVIELT